VDCLTAAEITLRLNGELGDSEPYMPAEIEACADKMPSLRKGRKEILPRVRMHARCGSSSGVSGIYSGDGSGRPHVDNKWSDESDSDVHARTLTDW